MSRVDDFFIDLDRAWAPPNTPRVRLKIIGSTALMLQADYSRGTKDSDVLETAELRGGIRERLMVLAGRQSRLHNRHGLYLDIVHHALPFLPEEPCWHEDAALSQQLTSFNVLMLDVVDVVVTKLKRFSPSDREDIDAMIRLDLVNHESLVTRFRSAVGRFAFDARGEELGRYRENLHQVERDLLGVEESEIELPSWVE